MLKRYGTIITDQERREFIEKVKEIEHTAGTVHYIPRHSVVKGLSTTPFLVWKLKKKMPYSITTKQKN